MKITNKRAPCSVGDQMLSILAFLFSSYISGFRNVDVFEIHLIGVLGQYGGEHLFMSMLVLFLNVINTLFVEK